MRELVEACEFVEACAEEVRKAKSQELDAKRGLARTLSHTLKFEEAADMGLISFNTRAIMRFARRNR